MQGSLTTADKHDREYFVPSSGNELHKHRNSGSTTIQEICLGQGHSFVWNELCRSATHLWHGSDTAPLALGWASTPQYAVSSCPQQKGSNTL